MSKRKYDDLQMQPESELQSLAPKEQKKNKKKEKKEKKEKGEKPKKKKIDLVGQGNDGVVIVVKTRGRPRLTEEQKRLRQEEKERKKEAKKQERKKNLAEKKAMKIKDPKVAKQPKQSKFNCDFPNSIIDRDGQVHVPLIKVAKKPGRPRKIQIQNQDKDGATSESKSPRQPKTKKSKKNKNNGGSASGNGSGSDDPLHNLDSTDNAIPIEISTVLAPKKPGRKPLQFEAKQRMEIRKMSERNLKRRENLKLKLNCLTEKFMETYKVVTYTSPQSLSDNKNNKAGSAMGITYITVDGKCVRLDKSDHIDDRSDEKKQKEIDGFLKSYQKLSDEIKKLDIENVDYQTIMNNPHFAQVNVNDANMNVNVVSESFTTSSDNNSTLSVNHLDNDPFQSYLISNSNSNCHSFNSTNINHSSNSIQLPPLNSYPYSYSDNHSNHDVHMNDNNNNNDPHDNNSDNNNNNNIDDGIPLPASLLDEYD